MKRCKKCIVRANAPGIKLNKDGVCNICETWEKDRDFLTDYAKLEKIFHEKINQHKGKFKYDVILGVSGGKDGVYLAHHLKNDLGLNVLGVTLDYGFMPNAFAKANIENMVKKLGIDHMYLELDNELSKKLFSGYLSKFTKATVCHMCSSILMPIMLLKAAVEQHVPYIMLGLDRGQMFAKLHLKHARNRVFENFAAYDLEKNNAQTKKIIHYMEQYFTELKLTPTEKEKLMPNSVELSKNKISPQFISYFMFFPYDEEMIKDTIEKEIGWRRPKGDALRGHFDCEMKIASAYAARTLNLGERLEYEFSSDIREGNMTREDALRRVAEHVAYIDKAKSPYEKINEHLGISDKKFARKVKVLSKVAVPYRMLVNGSTKIFGFKPFVEKMVFWIRPH